MQANIENVNLKSSNVQELMLKILLRIIQWLPLETGVTEAKLTTIMQISLLASSEKKTINSVCKSHKRTLSSVTVRNSLKLWFSDIRELEKILNKLLRATVRMKILRGNPVISTDVVSTEYYGDTSDQGLRKGKNKNGTNTFHNYSTVYLNVKGQRYTLAISYVLSKDTMLDVVKRLNREILRYGIKPKLWLLDRGYYCVDVIKWLKTNQKSFIMPAQQAGRKPDHPKGPSSTRVFLTWNRSGWGQYTMKTSSRRPKEGKKADSVTFDMAVTITYPDGPGHYKTQKILLYACSGLSDMKVRNIHLLYRSRFGIETSYRQAHQARARTASKSPTLRFFFFGLSLLMRNVWIFIHFHALYQKQKGFSSRKVVLEKFPFALMLDWLRTEAENTFPLITEIPLEDASLLDEVLSL